MPWEIAMAGETNGLRGKKRYLFLGGLRVPGIVRWPGRVTGGSVNDEPAGALDILPTLAELLDVELSPDRVIDGQSIAGLLLGNREFKRERIFYWSIPTPDGMEYAIRDGDWKMILNPDGEAEYLFNLVDDPYEIRNLLDEQPRLTKDLLEKFRAYRQSVENE